MLHSSVALAATAAKLGVYTVTNDKEIAHSRMKLRISCAYARKRSKER
jgi:rRNA-processing protein FCF1